MASEIKYCAKCERCHDVGLNDGEDCYYYGEPCGCNHPERGFAASENETVAEVLAEFGKNIELMRKCKCVGVSLWNCLNFKLRIEAAHEREIDGLKANLDALEKAVERVCSRDMIAEIIAVKKEIQDAAQ